jgi:hypothetical protein
MEDCMSMDHRWGVRERIEREVRIVGDSTTLRGRSVDVSFSGIFLAASPEEFALDSVVELVVTMQSAGVTAIQRVAAVVVRLNENGLGLMFAGLDPGEIIRFLALLNFNESFLVLRRLDSRALFLRPAIQDGARNSIVGGWPIGAADATSSDVGEDDYLFGGGRRDHGRTG